MTRKRKSVATITVAAVAALILGVVGDMDGAPGEPPWAQEILEALDSLGVDVDSLTAEMDTLRAKCLVLIRVALEDLEIGPRDARAGKPKPSRSSWYITPTGTDTETGSQGKTPELPWKTINYALNVATQPIAGDTFFCMTGTWEAPDAPSNVTIRIDLQGDRDFPTVISSYRGGHPVFDGTGYEGLDLGAFLLQNRGGVRFQDITFLNYFDEDTTANTSTAIIFQSNQTAEVDTFLGVDVLSCTFTVDDRGALGTEGRGRQCIRYFTNAGSSDPATDVIDRPFIENNAISRCGDHAIQIGWVQFAAIQSNLIGSELRFNRNDPVEGPDGIVAERPVHGSTISRNTITGFDHAINVRGQGWRINENWLYHLNDDGVFIDDVGSFDNEVTQNLIWDTGDDGIEVRGAGIISRNTIYHWDNSAFSFTAAGTDNWAIFDNIAVDACVCNPFNSPPQEALYTNIGVDVGANMAFNHNIYFDPQGAAFRDNRVGGPPVDFATWQAAGNDPDSFEQNPLFVDSLAANFAPFKAGPAVANSRFGGTIGGTPCADCLWWALSTQTGIDSVRAVTVDADRSILSAVWDGAVFQFGNTWVFDDPGEVTPSANYQQIAAHWTLHTRAKDSPQTAEDLIIIPPAPEVDRGRWFIDPNGDDANDGETAVTPWKTWDYALGFASPMARGDTLIASGGTWSGDDCPCDVAVTRGGRLAGAPTVVVGNGSVLDASAQTWGDCGGTFGQLFDIQTGNMIWRDIEIRDAPFNPGTSSGPGQVFYSNVDVGRLEFRDIRTTHVQRDSTMGLLRLDFDSNASGLAIVDCELGHSGPTQVDIAGICTDGRVANTTFNRYIAGSRNNKQLSAVSVGSQLSDFILENCTFINGGICANVSGVRSTIRECRFLGSLDEGLRVQGDDVVVRGNLFRENGAYGLHISGGARTLVEHNTFYRNGDRFSPSQVVSILTVGSGATDYTIRGNWFYRLQYHGRNGTFPPGGQMLLLSNGASSAPRQIDYNYYWDNGLGPGTPQPDAWIIDFSVFDFAGWQGLGFDVNSTFVSVGAEPTFVDSLTNNWTPISDGIRAAGDGATVGAWPGQDSQLWDIVLEARADSLNLRVIDPDKVVRYELPGSAIFRRTNIYLAETPPLDGVFGYWYGEWKVWDPAVFQNVSTRELLADAGGTLDYATIADSVWNPTSAEWRWRPIHAADSIAWNSGSGQRTGEFQVKDATHLTAIPYAWVRVFSDPLRTPESEIGNLTMNQAGTRGYAYEIGQNYYWRSWAQGYQTRDGQDKPQVDGFIFQVNLDGESYPITPDPQKCTMIYRTMISLGEVYEGARVEVAIEKTDVNFEGNQILPGYGLVEGVTDVNGVVTFDLIRSSELTPTGSKYKMRVTDPQSPARFSGIEVKGITAPDSDQAEVSENCTNCAERL